MIDFKKEAQEILEQVVGFRRDFHTHPEPSKEEFRTADIVAKHLESLGMEVKRDYAGELPSVVGLLKGSAKGPTVALRADMDALRLQEVTNPSYKSVNDGVMHACGHDAHTASLMGAAILLARHKDALKGNVKFIFEPAEEDIGGGRFMVPNGVLENPHVDAIFGIHVENAYPVGTIAVCGGEMMAASDRLIIRIKGRSAHGASPHLGIDAIMIAAHFLTALQTMMAREKDTFEHAIITFGQIKGGTARNIICDEVELNGICRTLNPATRELLNRRIDEILKGITMTFGGSYELERFKSHPALICDKAMTEHVCQTARDIVGGDHILTLPHGSLGCESFAYFTEAREGAFYWMGTGNPEKGIDKPLHSSSFDIEEEALAVACAMHASVAYRYLEKHSR
ncbi:MAG: amidohydrolase [Lachnospiraceae bacterium]|nr:amidohydrolase [Lachnospiraceae bacterium]